VNRAKLLVLFMLFCAAPSFAGEVKVVAVTVYLWGDSAGGSVQISNPSCGYCWMNAVGTGIPITEIQTNTFTGPFSPPYAVSDGVLDFNSYSGVYTVTGAVPSLGLLVPTVLAAGYGPGSLQGGCHRAACDLGGLMESGGPSDALLTALGITQSFKYGAFSLDVAFSPEGSGFTATSAYVGAAHSNIPEPVSIVLMGTFLSLAGGLLSKRKRT